MTMTLCLSQTVKEAFIVIKHKRTVIVVILTF